MPDAPMTNTTGLPQLSVLLPRDIAAQHLRAYAQQAETAGFAELWVVDDLGFRGGLTQAAVVLSCTSSIRVGIGILPAGSMSPAFAAMEIATLAQLFPGRIDVGFGHGMPMWMRSVGAWSDRPLRVLQEAVRSVRILLRGDALSSGVRLDPAVVPAVVPDLLLGVRGPNSLAASGRVADGTILAEPATVAYVAAARQQIAAIRPHRILAYNVAALDEDPAVGLARARTALQYVGEPDWSAHLVGLPFADELAALRRSVDTPAAFARLMPDEWVRALALVGTPEEVGERLRALGGAGVATAILAPAGPHPVQALRNFARLLPVTVGAA